MAEPVRPLPTPATPPVSARVGLPLGELPRARAAAAPEAANDDQELVGDSPVPSFNVQAANDDEEQGAFEEQAAQADARAQLRARQQQARVQERQAEEEAALEAAKAPLYEARDQGNDMVSKAALGSVVASFVWFPFQLIWGDLATKGKSTFVSPVTWRAVLPKLDGILPNTLAKAVALLLLIADVVILVLALGIVLILVYVQFQVFRHFLGPLASEVLIFLGLPQILP